MEDASYRAGPCDVTKKEDLEKLVKEIEGKEKHVNLLGRYCCSLYPRFCQQWAFGHLSSPISIFSVSVESRSRVLLWSFGT